MSEYFATEYKVVEVDTESSDENSDDGYVDKPCNSVADIYIETIKNLQTMQYEQLSSTELTFESSNAKPLNLREYVGDIITRVDRLEQRTSEKLKNISDLLRQLNLAIQ